LCKVRLAKFRGINRNTFYLHLKECEFRYNFRNENIYNILLKSTKNL
jgi:transposase